MFVIVPSKTGAGIKKCLFYCVKSSTLPSQFFFFIICYIIYVERHYIFLKCPGVKYIKYFAGLKCDCLYKVWQNFKKNEQT